MCYTFVTLNPKYFIHFEVFVKRTLSFISFSNYPFSSVTQSYPTICDPMDCSMPGLPVHHQIPEFTHSCPLSQWCYPTISFSAVPFSCLQSFPGSGSFLMNQIFESGGQSIGVSASASVLPVNTRDWFPLGWTGWISLQSKGLSRVFSSTAVQKNWFFGAQHSLCPTLTSIHNYWKNHSFDYIDLCQQSNVFTF